VNLESVKMAKKIESTKLFCNLLKKVLLCIRKTLNDSMVNMFRKIGMVFVLFFVTGAVFGQGFKFGILFDPTVTWLRSDVKDVIPVQVRMGFDLGMSADFYFAKNYAFATGISLFNTGGTLKYVNGIQNFRTKDGNVSIDPQAKVKYKVQYVKIPVALKLKTHMIGRFIYSANLGFDPMIRVAASADFNDEIGVHVNDEIKLLNMGWHFGVGTQYSLGGDASFFFGLSLMNTFVDMTQPMHDRITSNNLFFRFGIMF